MKIMVLMPLYKIMDAACVISLVTFQSNLNYQGHLVKFVFSPGFNAAKARKALSKFVAEDKDFKPDIVLWLDSDHIYDDKSLFSLIGLMNKYEIPMLSASYKMRGSVELAPGITDETGFHHFKYEDLKDDLVDCDVFGFGFLVMMPDVLVKLWEKYGDELFILDTKSNGTEDVTFCNCAKKEGYRVCFTPTVKIGHVESAMRI